VRIPVTGMVTGFLLEIDKGEMEIIMDLSVTDIDLHSSQNLELVNEH
jgi:hypothetical protein